MRRRFTAARPADFQLKVPGAREHVVIKTGAVIETREIIARIHDVAPDKLDTANLGRDLTALTAGARVLIPKH